MLRSTILTVSLLVVLLYVGCSDVYPATTPVPTVTEAPETEEESDDEVRIAVQRLFETWDRALRDKDAKLFRSILTRDIAAGCGLNDLQSWLDQDLKILREVVVRSVFVDVADPSRALADIIPMRDPGQSGEPPIYPWPLTREDGEWRAGFIYGSTGERCPFTAYFQSAEPDGREHDFPQIPGLDLDRREDILAVVPGTRVLHGSFAGENFGSSFSTGNSMSGYSNQVNIFAEVESDLDAAELVRLYSDGLKHSSWDAIDEGTSGDFGWFSWTVLDDVDRLWHGNLVAAPSNEGWRHVWLSLYSDDSGGGQ